MKRFTVFAQPGGCDSRHNGGINATGEKRADRGIGNHLPADGVAHEKTHLFHGIGVGIGVRSAGQIPVEMLADPLPCEGQIVAGEHFGDVLKNAASGCVRRTEREDFAQAVSRDGRGEAGIRKKRLRLRAKEQRAVFDRIEKRFDAGAVAVEQKGFLFLVPDGEGKDAV